MIESQDWYSQVPIHWKGKLLFHKSQMKLLGHWTHHRDQGRYNLSHAYCMWYIHVIQYVCIMVWDVARSVLKELWRIYVSKVQWQVLGELYSGPWRSFLFLHYCSVILVSSRLEKVSLNYRLIYCWILRKKNISGLVFGVRKSREKENWILKLYSFRSLI